MNRVTGARGAVWIKGVVSAAWVLGSAWAFSGCGGGVQGLTDRSSIVISDNAKITSRNLVPQANKYPEVVKQLGLAQEVYLQQLALLKDRRADVRSRKRFLNAGAFGTMALTAAGVSGAAMFAQEEDDDALQTAGTAALVGLTLGSALQIASVMQENPDAVDAKIRHLDTLYTAMIETLRQLAFFAESAPPGPEGVRARTQAAAQMGAAIESFMSAAQTIYVKG